MENSKSQICIQYAHSKSQDNPDLSIFWVFAGSRERFEQGYMEIAKAMKLKGLDDSGVDVLSLVKDALETGDHDPWMMIIDNADDMDLFYGFEDEGCKGNFGARKGLLSYVPVN